MQMLSTHHPHGPWVICTLSLWSPETGDDIGDHIYVISISSTCHLHVVPIDRGHPQPVPIVPDVVPIDRGHPQVVPMVPDVVPIERDHSTLFPGLFACNPNGPGRLGMTSWTTYVISTLSACHLHGP